MTTSTSSPPGRPRPARRQIQERYGIAKDEAEKQLVAWRARPTIVVLIEYGIQLIRRLSKTRIFSAPRFAQRTE